MKVTLAATNPAWSEVARPSQPNGESISRIAGGCRKTKS